AVIAKETPSRLPVFFPGQAGRYLPEFKIHHARTGRLIDLLLDPVAVTKIALAQLERFDVDAVLVPHDSVLLWHGLGIETDLDVRDHSRLCRSIPEAGDIGVTTTHGLGTRLEPYYHALIDIRKQLPSDVPLIGTSPCPFTLVSILLGRGVMPPPEVSRVAALSDQPRFMAMLDIAEHLVIDHLLYQIRAGAQAVVLAGPSATGLAPEHLDRFALTSLRKVVLSIHDKFARALVIGQPDIDGLMLPTYLAVSTVDAVIPPPRIQRDWLARHLKPLTTIIGNLDPVLVEVGGEAMVSGARAILNRLNGGPFMFSTGANLTDRTPPHHIARLIRMVREWTP
ncbi:MAG: uroporphyrinogen decarboxylase family protein, partial [Pseudomonadota bacterium]|nr:uroporphyrinogen decarboxylase family protein [Pseudomonadota bacterium]